MKKAIAVLMLLVLVTAMVPTTQAATKGQGRGGFMGFIAGCCFGVRAGAAYNDGKEIHWREWVSLIPWVNIVFAIWNGVDGANGVSTGDLAAKYGAVYY